MARIIVLYSTTDGHTRKICETIQAILRQLGHTAESASLDDILQVNPDLFDKIVIGASIRYGKHNKRVYDFVARNVEILKDRPSAFFSVNVVARKPGKDQPENNPYMRKFLGQVTWEPTRLAVFAGKIDYRKYRFFDRLLIRFIMLITHGPTDPQTVADFTNWKHVEKFARDVSEM